MTKNANLENFINKLNEKTATVAIVGLGYVGLPIVIRFSDIGFKVIGFDIDENKTTRLNQGESYIEHISSEAIQTAVDNGFEATVDFQRISDTDAIILCVPTPLKDNREPDLQFVLDTTDAIVPHLKPGQLISLESTTYPGTTEEELLPRIRSHGFNPGDDIFLVYSPEREDPGNPSFNTQTIPKVCGGYTADCLEAGVALYSHAVDTVVQVSSLKTAEMTKLLENIHRAVNIGLVNEMKMVADRMGINIHEVIDAAKTKPFGFTPYYPGPGLGGHCIPIDPFYLTWKAKQYGVDTRFIELAGEVNTSMPNWVISKLEQALNDKNLQLKDCKILILGLAYKKNIDDTRETPATTIMALLRKQGAEIEYSDPHVPSFPDKRNYKFDLDSVTLNKASLQLFDAVVLVTDHDLFDYELIKSYSSLLIDTRGRFARDAAPNIISA